MISSTPQNRSAARLVLLVAEERVESNPLYAKRDIDGIPGDETFCNWFARTVCKRMGCPIPENMRANELNLWLKSELAKAAGWERTDAHTAQAMADQGCLAVASWFNPMKSDSGKSKPGHIAVLMPSLGEPGVWAAQAGQVNFSHELLQRGFGAIAPDYFCHA